MRRTGDLREVGMVTAELAVALPVLLLMLAAGFGAISVAASQVRAQDQAREIARLVARGDSSAADLVDPGGWPGPSRPSDSGSSDTSATTTAGRVVSVTRSATQVRVTVRQTVRPFSRLLPAMTVAASAVAAREPDVAGVPP